MSYFPRVSIVVAARNEEENILRCVQSLDALNYPKEYLEILIGNDDSTDHTATIVEGYISQKPYFELFTIQKKLGKLSGKANVLAHLLNKATGEYYLFIDADIAVPTNLIQTFLRAFDTPNVGVVTGITTMQNDGLFARLQGIEWLYSLSIIHWFAQWNIPITGMGNNMMVSKNAYWATGGYEKIGFSIVEDYTLFQAIIRQKYQFKQLFEPNAMAVSVPQPNLDSLLMQRKRWIVGAMQLPWYIQLGTWANALFIPMLIAGLCFAPLATTLFALSFYVVQLCYLMLMLQKLTLTQFRRDVPLFACYYYPIFFAMFAHYFFPSPTTWKGREYRDLV